MRAAFRENCTPFFLVLYWFLALLFCWSKLDWPTVALSAVLLGELLILERGLR